MRLINMAGRVAWGKASVEMVGQRVLARLYQLIKNNIFKVPLKVAVCLKVGCVAVMVFG